MTEHNKPFSTLNNPLILDHMKKVVELEVELGKQNGFDPLMILEYHLQLAAIAISAGSGFDENVVPMIFTSACEQLRAMVREEMQEYGEKFIFPVSETVN